MSHRHAPTWGNVPLLALVVSSALSWGCSLDDHKGCTDCEAQADASTGEMDPLDADAREDAASNGPSNPALEAPTGLGEGSAGGSSRCATTEAPVTEQVERDYHLAALRQQLEQRHVFQAEHRTWNQDGETAVKGSIAVELVIELGEFTFHASNSNERDYCNSVRAPLSMQVRGQGARFAFTAQGTLWLEEASLETHVYATADPASVTGDVFPQGLVEVTLSVFARQVRGELQSRGITVSLTPDACAQHELPLAPDEHVDFLGGRSVAELVTETEDILQHTATYAAVWQDGTQTTLTIELGGGATGDACVRSELPFASAAGYRNQPHAALRIPYAGRLRTGDGRLALPIEQLVLAVGVEDGALWSVDARADALASDFGDDEDSVRGEGDRLDAQIAFDLTREPASADGIIQIQDALGPTSWTPVDCVAWPIGGSWDRNQCRYQR